MNRWFLIQIEDIVREEQSLKGISHNKLDYKNLLNLKRKGFADKRIADLLNCDESIIRDKRKSLGITPSYKCVDTCLAGFQLPLLTYSTYGLTVSQIRRTRQNNRSWWWTKSYRARY